MVLCACIPADALFTRACALLMTLRTPPAGCRMQPKAVAGRMREMDEIVKSAQREAKCDVFLRIHSQVDCFKSALGLCYMSAGNTDMKANVAFGALLKE